MEIKKVKGIIISDVNYSESSKILNVLTKEYGMIGIISKGCRNLKSKLRSVSLKLTYGYFHIYYKEGGLSTLISVDVEDEFLNIKKDLTLLGFTTYLIDLITQVEKQNKNNDNIFNLLSNSLIKINEGFNPKIITEIVEIKALAYLGVMPIIDSCAICGSTKNIVTISSDDGGYVCSNCYNNQYLTDQKTIKLIRMFYYVDITKIKELNILDKNINEIGNFLESYYDKYTGLYLKSKNFLERLKK